MATGDWDNDYLNRLKASRFDPTVIGDRLNTVQYEDWQPPLYYLLAAPIYRLSGGSLTALRLFSVFLGALVVIVAFFAVREVFPASPWIALGTSTFIAFLPQHLAIMAGVGNDSLTELVAALILLACIRYRSGTFPVWGLGLLMGVAIWTKGTVYPYAAVIALAILLRARAERWNLSRLLRAEVVFVAIALLIGGWWWLRNISTYGGLDFLAQNAHDHVVIGQPLTSVYIADHGVSGWLSDWARITFQSFWGQFGWMGVPLSDGIYRALLILSALIVIGAILALLLWQKSLTSVQRDSLLVMLSAVVLVSAAYAYYNLKYVQFQGRYLFPALVPIACAMIAGVGAWAALISRLRPRARGTITSAFLGVGALAMAGFSVYLLFRVIVPALSLP